MLVGCDENDLSFAAAIWGLKLVLKPATMPLAD
jgi:hypothetical protein